LIARFSQQGLTPARGTSAEFQATIASDLKNFSEIARAANIKAE
jgi:tripartite-type tricarboxylate transporter receptor subunit TctC